MPPPVVRFPGSLNPHLSSCTLVFSLPALSLSLLRLSFYLPISLPFLSCTFRRRKRKHEAGEPRDSGWRSGADAQISPAAGLPSPPRPACIHRQRCLVMAAHWQRRVLQSGHHPYSCPPKVVQLQPVTIPYRSAKTYSIRIIAAVCGFLEKTLTNTYRSTKTAQEQGMLHPFH